MGILTAILQFLIDIFFLIGFGFIVALIARIPAIKLRTTNHVLSRVLLAFGLGILALFVAYLGLPVIFAFGYAFDYEQGFNIEVVYTMWLQMISISSYCISNNASICEFAAELAQWSPSGSWGELIGWERV